jgi:hypothetical protein
MILNGDFRAFDKNVNEMEEKNIYIFEFWKQKSEKTFRCSGKPFGMRKQSLAL